MPEGGYKIRNQQGLHLITFAVVGWIDDETEFVYSSARDYAGEKGLIELEILK